MTKVIEENENVKKIVEIENEIFYDTANQHGKVRIMAYNMNH